MDNICRNINFRCNYVNIVPLPTGLRCDNFANPLHPIKIKLKISFYVTVDEKNSNSIFVGFTEIQANVLLGLNLIGYNEIFSVNSFISSYGIIKFPINYYPL